MLCFVCGEQMRVVGVEPHVVDIRGFELRTFQCVGCGDVETRTVFDTALAVRASAPVPISDVPVPKVSRPDVPASKVPVPEGEAAAGAPSPAPAATASKMRSIIGTLVRLRTPQA